MNGKVKESRASKKGIAYLLAGAGPGFIMAATGIGPSSLVTSSNAGSNFGYTLFWWFILILVFQGLFSISANTYATVTGRPVMVGIRSTYGKGWAIVVSICTMIGQTTFCIGNFIGCGLGFNILFPGLPIKYGGLIAAVLCVAFLFLKNLYQKIEQVMKVLVFLMAVIFIASVLASLRIPYDGAVSHSLIGIPEGSFVTMLSILGATVHLAGACYHSSLTREKGYTVEDVERGGVRADAITYVVTLGIVSICCYFVGANLLPGQPVANGGQLADALAANLGSWVRPVFGIGLLSAALSSLIMAPKLGINLLLQALDKKSGMDNKAENIITILMIAFGVIVGLINNGIPTQLLSLVSIGNIINMPITGIMLILLCNRKADMGKYRASKGFTVALVISFVFVMITVVNNLINLLSGLMR